MAVDCPMVLTACSRQRTPDAEEGAPAAPEMPPKVRGAIAGAPSAHGFGAAFAGRPTVHGEANGLTDNPLQGIERDRRTPGAYGLAAVAPDPGGACDGVAQAPRNPTFRDRADWTADGGFLGASEPDTARVGRPLQAADAWCPLPQPEDRAVRPGRGGGNRAASTVPA